MLKHRLTLTLFLGVFCAHPAIAAPDNACEIMSEQTLSEHLNAPVKLELAAVDEYEQRRHGLASRCKVMFTGQPPAQSFAEQFSQPAVTLSLYSAQSFANANKLMLEQGKKARLDFEQHWEKLNRSQTPVALPRGQGVVRQVAVGKLTEHQGILRHKDLLIVASVANMPEQTAPALLQALSEHGKF